MPLSFSCLPINWLNAWLNIPDSEYDGDPNELILGDEVEYNIKCKNGKVSAEMVVKLARGTITQEQILPEVYVGKVLRSLRRADPQVRLSDCSLNLIVMFILFFDFTIYFKDLKTNAFFCLDMYVDHFFSVGVIQSSPFE